MIDVLDRLLPEVERVTMTGPVEPQPDDPSAIVVSRRSSQPDPWRCTGYEFEDVVASVTRATLVDRTARFDTHATSSTLVRRSSEVLLHLSAGRVRGPGSYERLSPPRQPADILVVYCQHPYDVLAVVGMGDLRRWAHKAICFVEEVYITELDRWAGASAVLNGFDHVWVSNEDTVPHWQDRLDTKLGYLPFSVDAERFAPKRVGRPRPIAVSNIGRRSETTHNALYDWSLATDHLYHFDSMRPGAVKDPAQHRVMMATMLQRSAVAVSNRGVGGRPKETNWQGSLPPRFFEAAAAGAVLLGVAPDLPGMSAYFGWTDSHLPMAFDEPEAGAIVAHLLDQTERMTIASRRNIAQCLRRHDHVHRLAAMMAAVGVPLGPLAAARQVRLAELATMHETAPVGTRTSESAPVGTRTRESAPPGTSESAPVGTFPVRGRA